MLVNIENLELDVVRVKSNDLVISHLHLQFPLLVGEATVIDEIVLINRHGNLVSVDVRSAIRDRLKHGIKYLEKCKDVKGEASVAAIETGYVPEMRDPLVSAMLKIISSVDTIKIVTKLAKHIVSGGVPSITDTVKAIYKEGKGHYNVEVLVKLHDTMISNTKTVHIPHQDSFIK